jgi:hypothetical protein
MRVSLIIVACLVRGGEPAPARAKSASALAPTESQQSSTPTVVYDVGWPKTGTSSFADYAWRSLGLVAWHEQTAALHLLGGAAMASSCTEFTEHGSPASYPAYHLAAAEYNATGLLGMFHAPGVGAWADSPIDMFFQTFDDLDDAKYVIWARDSDEYMASFEAFFCEEGLGSAVRNDTYIQNAWRLRVGMCDMCDWNGGRREQVRSDNMRQVQAIYEAHLNKIAATLGPTGRLHYINMTDALAGRALCEFVYAVGSPICANLTDIPDVEPNELSDEMKAQSFDAVLAAYPSVGLTNGP